MFTNTESWAPHTEAVATFPKSHIIECFFNMVAVSKHLGLAFKTRPLPTVGSGRRRRRRRRKKKAHLKLNLKMCFSWKPGCAAINQGRHFHAPHFSWFLSEFPPFLSHSTLAPELPTAALAADHSQRGTVGWPVPPSQAWTEALPPTQKLCWLSLDGSLTVENPSENLPPGQHYFLSPPFSNNTLPTHPELMANSNQL